MTNTRFRALAIALTLAIACKGRKSTATKSFSELSRAERCEAISEAAALVVREETQRVGTDVMREALVSSCDGWPASAFACDPFDRRQATPECVESLLAIADEGVRRVRAMAKPGPRVQWDARLSAAAQVSVSFDDENDYEISQSGIVVGRTAAVVFAIRDGEGLWKRSLEGLEWQLVTTSSVLVADAKRILALDLLSGETRWSVAAPMNREFESTPSPAQLATLDLDDRLLIGTSDGRFFRVDQAACSKSLEGCTLSPSGVLKGDPIDHGEVVVGGHGNRFLVATRDYDKETLEALDSSMTPLFVLAAQDRISGAVAVVDAEHLAAHVDGAVVVLNVLACKSPEPFALATGTSELENCPSCLLPPDGCVVSQHASEGSSQSVGPMPFASGSIAFLQGTSVVASRRDTILWKVDVNAEALWSDEDKIYALCRSVEEGDPGLTLRSLSPIDGTPLWETPVPVEFSFDLRLQTRGEWILVGNRDHVALLKLPAEEHDRPKPR